MPFTEKDELYYFLKSAGLYRNICTNIFGICTKKTENLYKFSVKPHQVLSMLSLSFLKDLR